MIKRERSGFRKVLEAREAELARAMRTPWSIIHRGYGLWANRCLKRLARPPHFGGA